MKKTLVALSLAAMAIPALAQQKAPEPDLTLEGNFGIVSDYRFRGISQTDKKPAAQGGFDLGHKSGLYAGVWTSNVSQWTAGGASQEIDVYAGYKLGLPMGIEADLGYIRYEYPGNTAGNKTREFYFGLSYGPLSYKASRTTTNWFGYAPIAGVDDGILGKKGSMYHDLSFEYGLTEKITLSAHLGLQKVKGTNADFKDYSVGASYEIGDGYSVGLTATKTSFDSSDARDNWFVGGSGVKLYESAVVASISKSF
jgi:uncharacterized protein (TIGR02001 family)